MGLTTRAVLSTLTWYLFMAHPMKQNVNYIAFINQKEERKRCRHRFRIATMQIDIVTLSMFARFTSINVCYSTAANALTDTVVGAKLGTVIQYRPKYYVWQIFSMSRRTALVTVEVVVQSSWKCWLVGYVMHELPGAHSHEPDVPSALTEWRCLAPWMTLHMLERAD